jgi:hypothetical protein
MRSLKVAPITLTLAAGVGLCAPSYTHAQATEQRGATPQRTSPQPKLFDPKDTVASFASTAVLVRNSWIVMSFTVWNRPVW